MRIDQIFADARTAGAQPVSFEMFPPKGELTLERAREVAAQFATDEPDFISVTYSAGGSGNSAAPSSRKASFSVATGIFPPKSGAGAAVATPSSASLSAAM